MEYSDYINKILSILDNTSKCRKLSDTSLDDTTHPEVKSRKRLLEFKSSSLRVYMIEFGLLTRSVLGYMVCLRFRK